MRLETEGENSQVLFWRFVDCFYKCDLSQIPSEINEYQYPIIIFFFVEKNLIVGTFALSVRHKRKMLATQNGRSKETLQAKKPSVEPCTRDGI